MSDVENRRAEFLRLIGDYSESRYCAGWASGIEEQIRREGGLWVFMAFGAGGWPLGYEGEEGWVPLSDSEVTLVTSMIELNRSGPPLLDEPF